MSAGLLSVLLVASAALSPAINLQWGQDRVFVSAQVRAPANHSKSRLTALLNARVYVTNERAEVGTLEESSVSLLPSQGTETSVTWWREYTWPAPPQSVTLHYGLTQRSTPLLCRDLVTGTTSRATLTAAQPTHTLTRRQRRPRRKVPEHARAPQPPPTGKGEDDDWAWVLSVALLAVVATWWARRRGG